MGARVGVGNQWIKPGTGRSHAKKLHMMLLKMLKQYILFCYRSYLQICFLHKYIDVLSFRGVMFFDLTVQILLQWPLWIVLFCCEISSTNNYAILLAKVNQVKSHQAALMKLEYLMYLTLVAFPDFPLNLCVDPWPPNNSSSYCFYPSHTWVTFM